MKLGGITNIVWPLRVMLDRGLSALFEDKANRETLEALGGTQVVRMTPSQVEAITIEFTTPVPSKKNSLKPTGRRGMSYIASVKKQMLDLQLFATSQWAGRPPVEHPVLHFRLAARLNKQDRDGMVTTLMDVLKKSGVIVDDSIQHCNGLMLIYPASVENESESFVSRVTVEYPYFPPPRRQVT